MLKKLILFFVSTILIFLALGYWAFHSPKAAAFLVRTIFNHSSPDVKLVSLYWEKHRLRWLQNAYCSGIVFILDRDGVRENYSLKSVALKKTADFEWYIELKDLDMESAKDAIENLNVSILADFKNNQLKRLKGNMEVSKMMYNRWTISNVRSEIGGGTGQIKLINFSADCYKGKMRSEILLDYEDKLSYIIQSELTDVDISDLRDLSKSFFSQIEGRMNGDFKISGNSEKVISVDGFLDMASGGMVKAALLSQIVAYLPQSTQRKELEDLIATQGQVPLDKATVSFRNIDRNQLRADMDLESQKLNLNLNLAIDISLDTDFARLIGFNPREAAGNH